MRRLIAVSFLGWFSAGCGLFGGSGATPQPQAERSPPTVQPRPSVTAGAARSAPPTVEVPEALPVAGWVRVSQESTVPAGGVRQVRVTCPAGKRVFGGGGSGAVAMSQSYPASESEWTTVFVNETGLDLSVVAWAICAETGVTDRPEAQSRHQRRY